LDACRTIDPDTDIYAGIGEMAQPICSFTADATRDRQGAEALEQLVYAFISAALAYRVSDEGNGRSK
jgi:hypothetical protein